MGDSRPAITCPTPPVDPAVTRFPATPRRFRALVAHNRAVAESCRRATGPLVDHVDTVSAARDFDAVRAAPGEERVSRLGRSRGTLLGATYAQLFPSRVRAAVLDGAVDRGIGVRRMAFDEARGTEDAFSAFAGWCAVTESCALHGGDVAAEYRGLARARGTPAGRHGSRPGRGGLRAAITHARRAPGDPLPRPPRRRAGVRRPGRPPAAGAAGGRSARRTRGRGRTSAAPGRSSW
ncbi:alpha/beta fold hydrolase [Saccharothrix syringae]|uniref:alpha/beta fold hydrolase n=1 Tax=Saccharothrix syringae TaxID=103733 RepID=UPI000ADEBA54|nr:alpha/beta fold hydrolase [Saccharothrix syringae]